MSDSKKPLFAETTRSNENIEQCPNCASKLIIKHSKKGSFWGCETYPECEFTKPLVEYERIDDKELPGSTCPKCSHTLAVKQGRYGMFIGCTNFPACDHIEDNQNKADAGVACPSCHSGELFEKSNRFGKTFYACDQYPKCKYVLNHKPVNQICPDCDWSVLIERKMANGDVLVCPQKKCNYKQPIV